MKIDYQKILKEIEWFAPQHMSTRKKFKQRNSDHVVNIYKIYFSRRKYFYDQNAARKYYNHIKSQGLLPFSKVAQLQYNHNTFYRVNGKGIFKFYIRNINLGQSEFSLEITRNTILLSSHTQTFNLDDKSERFAAAMYFSFDYDYLVKIQNLLKKKPSGFYNIYSIYTE